MNPILSNEATLSPEDKTSLRAEFCRRYVSAGGSADWDDADEGFVYRLFFRSVDTAQDMEDLQDGVLGGVSSIVKIYGRPSPSRTALGRVVEVWDQLVAAAGLQPRLDM